MRKRDRWLCVLLAGSVNAPGVAEAAGGVFVPIGESPAGVGAQHVDVVAYLGPGPQGQSETRLQMRLRVSERPGRFAWVFAVPEGTRPGFGSAALFTALGAPTLGGVPGAPTVECAHEDSLGPGSGSRAPQAGGSAAPLEEPSAALVPQGLEQFDAAGDGALMSWLDAFGLQATPEELEELDAQAPDVDWVAVAFAGGASGAWTLPVRLAVPEPKLRFFGARNPWPSRWIALADGVVLPVAVDTWIAGALARDRFSDRHGHTVASEALSAGAAAWLQFAGPNRGFDARALFDGAWDAQSLADMSASQVLEALREWDLYRCDRWDGCRFRAPIGALLRKHLPAPAGVSEVTYYGEPDTVLNPAQWDADALAVDFFLWFLEPAREAAGLSREFPMRTDFWLAGRDVTFTRAADLGEVREPDATWTRLCDGRELVRVAEPRAWELALESAATWPRVRDAPLFFASVRAGGDGGVSVVEDGAAAFTVAADAHNDRLGWPEPAVQCNIARGRASPTSGSWSWVSVWGGAGLWLAAVFRRRQGRRP